MEPSTSRCPWLNLMSSSPVSVSTETDHLLCAASPQVLLGAGAAPRLDAHVVFRSHSSDRDRHPLPAARPKGDVKMCEELIKFLSARMDDTNTRQIVN